MTGSSLALDQEPARYPLSFTQEWFITLDQGDDGGTFGPRFMIVCPVRVTGHVDLAVLQGALRGRLGQRPGGAADEGAAVPVR
jgi:hypothetical protein